MNEQGQVNPASAGQQADKCPGNSGAFIFAYVDITTIPAYCLSPEKKVLLTSRYNQNVHTNREKTR